MKKLTIVALLLSTVLGTGCKKAGSNHEVEHGLNVKSAAEYGADLDACFKAAETQFVNGAPISTINADYDACHAAADIKARRK